MDVERLEEKVVHEEEDCEIVESSKKKVASKQNVIPKKKAPKVVVKVEGEGAEANRMWEDSEVLHLIALKGEMKPEFERNCKKQGKICMF